MAGKKDQAPEAEAEEREDCPKCPPPGAPAWMATFADMATLLMAFFVLILSFAEMNVPKFKQISGSMRDSFGVQRIIPVVEQPKGTTILSLNFSPSPNQSVTKEMTNDTQDQTKKEIKVPTDQKIARAPIDFRMATKIVRAKAVRIRMGPAPNNQRMKN